MSFDIGVGVVVGLRDAGRDMESCGKLDNQGFVVLRIALSFHFCIEAARTKRMHCEVQKFSFVS